MPLPDLQPFSPDELEEIALPGTPLELVVAQVRFPLLARAAKMEAVADFQEALGREFPLLEEEKELGITLTSEGVKPLEQTSTVWRLYDRDRRWRLSLAPTFLALDTTKYDSRTAFLERLGRVLDAFASCFEPSSRSRVGVRYVNRLALRSPDELHSLVRREVLGVAAAPQVKESGALRLGLSEALFRLGDESLRIRAALLPARTVVPALQLPPMEELSWALDLDMFRDDQDDFSSEQIHELCLRCSKQIYRFFRWTVTDEFLRRCGGRV